MRFVANESPVLATTGVQHWSAIRNDGPVGIVVVRSDGGVNFTPANPVVFFTANQLDEIATFMKVRQVEMTEPAELPADAAIESLVTLHNPE